MRTEDLTGKRFGRWTAIRKTPSSEKGEIRWDCICDCGTQRSVSERSLLRGRSKSCGCLQKESASITAASARVISFEGKKQSWPSICVPFMYPISYAAEI